MAAVETITPYLFMAASTALSMQQAHGQAKAANAAAQAQADAEARQIQASQAIEERRRREQLLKTLAAQRARAGAAGVGGAGGSLEALLQGLSNENERGLDDMRRLNLLRTDDIYSNLAHSRRRNLLAARNSQLSSLLSLAERGYNRYDASKERE